MKKRSLVLWVPLVAAFLAAVFVRLPYYAVGPGPAREVVPLIDVKGHPTYDAGSLVMTTVSYRQVTLLSAARAWIDRDEAVVGKEQLYPVGETVAQEQQRSLSQMEMSKIAATSVVLRTLTRYPRINGGQGVLVEAVGPDCPAEGKLSVGDLIRSIDGTPIEDVSQASDAIGGVQPGVPIAFGLGSGETERVVRVARGRCPGLDRPVVGISMVNDFPFDVSISSGAIGGSSAGMMYALGLYDLLTPGDLTGGRVVAGTGTIDLDGNIGPIDAIGDKIVAARGVGAAVFLLPKDDLAEARTVDAGEMRLIPVSTLDEALAALGAGGT